MKKAILITGIMMFAASNVFAATTLAVFTTTVPTGLTGFTQSKNVGVAYGSTASYFAASAKNTNGNKIYGAISTQSSVYQKDGTVGTAIVTGDNPTIPTAQGDAISSGWTSM